MTRLQWGVTTEKLYETGIDRGVLYVDNLPGVVWNGIVSITEEPGNSEATPYYIDGHRYQTIVSASDYSAKLEAYYSPKEFDVCDGTSEIYDGLFITHQRRKAFGLAYRSQIGDAANGLEYAYRIHLIYGAVALPSGKNYTTISASTNLTPLVWDIQTTPPIMDGYRSTGHVYIDSRTTDPALLLHLEDILYGTDDDSPRLPSFEELVDMFRTPYDFNLDILNLDEFVVSGWTVRTLPAGAFTMEHDRVVDNGDGTYTITEA